MYQKSGTKKEFKEPTIIWEEIICNIADICWASLSQEEKKTRNT